MRYIILFLLIVLVNNSQAQSDCNSDFIPSNYQIDTNYEFSLGVGILDSVNIHLNTSTDSFLFRTCLHLSPIKKSSQCLSAQFMYSFASFESKLKHERNEYAYYIGKNDILKGRKFFPTENGYNCVDINPYADSLLPKWARRGST